MIFRYLTRTERILLVLMLALVFAQVYLEFEIPGYMSSITDVLTSYGTPDDIAPYAWRMMLCAFLALGALLANRLLVSYVASGLACRLRSLEFDKVQSFSSADINRFSAASLITRSTNDITQIQNLLTIATVVATKAPLMVVWGLYKILGRGWEWTLATAIGVVLIILIEMLMIFIVVPKYRKMQWLTDNVNRETSEHLAGMRVVRAYNAEAYQRRKFDKANDELTGTALFAARSLSVLNPMMFAVQNILTLSFYILGAVMISAASMPDRLVLFSDMIVFSSYAMLIVVAFILLGDITVIIPRAAVAARRVSEIIEYEPDIRDGEVSESPEGIRGEVEFRNVSFRYGDGGYVLKDISFKAMEGETVAIIGSTGCGKTSLVNLIPRFYDADEGSVFVDGVDVKDYRLDVLHSKIGYVPQRATLFTGSVSDNVNFGAGSSDRTEDDVRRAVAIAQGTEFVEALEGGYDGSVSEKGVNLSGGQKQRISIARALCARPEIFIFDDSFSALDYRTDRDLRDALRRETAGTTTIVVAQRVGTVMDADRILVIDNGELVGNGTHRELMEGCPVYREIALSQLSEEELV
ncbi:MAG: ABC transporter ATP-binding protein [Candidatus Methanomethylophilaceae archaeon]|nr:ABC transporter ATP-binding protein [Candidatus Methanomethylophilaceae archaeon]